MMQVHHIQKPARESKGGLYVVVVPLEFHWHYVVIMLLLFLLLMVTVFKYIFPILCTEF